MGQETIINPLFSVLMPTYNRASTYLKGALESFRSQDYENKELVIVNDGSTDSTEDVIGTFIKDSGCRVRYLKTDNQGERRALNLGISCVLNNENGLFCILNDDNEITPSDALSKIVREFELYPSAECIYASGYNIDDKGNTINEYNALDFPPDLKAHWQEEHIHSCGMVWRVSALEKVGLYDLAYDWCGDTDIKLKTLMRCKTIPSAVKFFAFRMHANRKTEDMKMNPKIWHDEEARIKDALKDEYERCINGT
jgi:glycosyltransferase involved in cell wall biosynthesis